MGMKFAFGGRSMHPRDLIEGGGNPKVGDYP